jgi:hypothetical protein
LSLTERQRFWLEHLRACGSGSLKAYAEAHGLELGTLYEAKSRLKRMGALDARTTRFARVQCEAPSAPPSVCRVHLCNGAVVEVACAPEHWSTLFDSVAALR